MAFIMLIFFVRIGSLDYSKLVSIFLIQIFLMSSIITVNLNLILINY